MFILGSDPKNIPFNNWLRVNGVYLALAIAILLIVIVIALFLLSINKKH